MKQLAARFARWLIQGLISVTLFGAFAVFMLDYLAGCGQTYIDAKGVQRSVAKDNECIFIANHKGEHQTSRDTTR